MSAAPVQPFIASPGPTRLQRSISLGLVALLHLLLLLMLLRMVSPLVPEKIERMNGTLTVVTVHDATPDTSHAAKAKQQSKATAQRQATAPPKPPKLASPSDLAAARMAAIWAQVVPLDCQQLASVDKAMTAPAMQTADAGETGAAADDTAGPGHGPNGETLYNARWYREPTHAELDTYLPKGTRRSGWGLIACRTVAHYHVEDCVELGQSPGSGLAGAVRQAAWQFLVYPPRIGGHQLVGSWVRIRVDYRVVEAKAPSPEGEPMPD